MTTKAQLIEDIKTSLNKAKNTNMLDKQNKYMTASLLKAKNECKGSKRTFIKLAKKYTGLLKSNDPIILECLKQWF